MSVYLDLVGDLDFDDAIDMARTELRLEEGYLSSNKWNDVLRKAKWILSEDKKIKHRNYLKSERWELIRKWCMQRDNYECQDCLKIFPLVLNIFNKIPHDKIKYRRRASEVHHDSYINLPNSKESEMNDCVSLCNLHHRKRHSRFPEDWHKKATEEILTGIYNEMLMQPWAIKEAKEQQKSWIKSLTIKPKKWLEDIPNE
ncbi:MAG: hypothetical protein CMC55_00135 [Flavobacteriaceae bacterium]|nr:hypothetical protein [Flavobacteriaceae bacterium]